MVYDDSKFEREVRVLCPVCGCTTFYGEEKLYNEYGVGVLELVCSKCGHTLKYDIGW